MKSGTKWLVWRAWVGITLATLVLSAFLAIGGLRHNNWVMGQLRTAVFVADRDGGDVEAALSRLRDHVIHHMNADLVQNRETTAKTQTEKPIQLAHKYYRDTLAVHRDTVGQLSSEMVVSLDQARAICEVETVSISERLVCLQQETQRLGGTGYPPIEPLVKDFYVFDYVSPDWSPDLAGWSIVTFWLSLGLVIASFLLGPVLTLAQSLIAGRPRPRPQPNSSQVPSEPSSAGATDPPNLR